MLAEVNSSSSIVLHHLLFLKAVLLNILVAHDIENSSDSQMIEMVSIILLSWITSHKKSLVRDWTHMKLRLEWMINFTKVSVNNEHCVGLLAEIISPLWAKLPLIKIWVQNIYLTLGLTFFFLKSWNGAQVIVLDCWFVLTKVIFKFFSQFEWPQLLSVFACKERYWLANLFQWQRIFPIKELICWSSYHNLCIILGIAYLEACHERLPHIKYLNWFGLTVAPPMTRLRKDFKICNSIKPSFPNQFLITAFKYIFVHKNGWCND